MRTRTALAALLIVSSVVGAEPASQPADYPALRKRLVELSAIVEQLQQQVKTLQAENGELKGKLKGFEAEAAAQSLPGTASDERAKKLHEIAMGGHVLIQRQDYKVIIEALGKPDDDRMSGSDRVMTWTAGEYSLTVSYNGGYGMTGVSESGPIPR